MVKTIDGKLETVEIMPETTEDEIVQNLKTIVSTTLGEAPMCRDVGVSSESKHRSQNVAEVLLTRDIYTAIREQETRADLRNVEYKDMEEWGVIAPVLEVEMGGG